MSLNSSIEWTESTWNPLTGCTKISPGCKNCYAERMAKRLQLMGVENYRNGFKLTMHKNSLLQPISWKKPQMIFVNSMSDLFHKDVSTDFILEVFNTMNISDWHIFQVLTKRPERLLELEKFINWTDNIWMGVSVESKEYLNRIRLLKRSRAKVRFISFEPLLGPISKVSLNKIDWVIAGGESGPKARPVDKQWIRGIRDLCINYDVPFFFKQWGGFNKKKNGNVLDGKTWNELPQIRLVI
jgi:protein gp37